MGRPVSSSGESGGPEGVGLGASGRGGLLGRGKGCAIETEENVGKAMVEGRLELLPREVVRDRSSGRG